MEVFRDNWGIPHVRVGSERDAFVAQGFVTAQDRLWHMDLDRHRALGRRAEFLGQTRLPRDRVLRRMRIERAARADYETSSPAARAMLDSFADGVNAFIDSTKTLPIEYSILGTCPEFWEPWHGLATYKIRNMLMGTYEGKLWRVRAARALGPKKAAALFRGYQTGHLITIPSGKVFDGPDENCVEELVRGVSLLEEIGAGIEGGADALFDSLGLSAELFGTLSQADAGSNSWVIAGNRTHSGLPLVAGDSHRGLDVPNVYYQIHLTCPDWAVSGYSVPGLPGAPHFSHTEFVGYGMTHGQADYQDLFVEKFREREGRLEYFFKGRWLVADVSVEEISSLDGGKEKVENFPTHHGGVIVGEPRKGWGIALSTTGTNQGTPWADSVYLALRARSADDLEHAMREWTEPVNNFTYCDVTGNFGYRLRGRIPVRHTSNRWCPVPGWDGKHEWLGMIPFDDMPAVRNPDSGYVVTCNQRVSASSYPHYLGIDFAPEYRAKRITDRLYELPVGEANVADMSGIHGDRISIPARAFVDIVRSLSPETGSLSDARQRLCDWEFSMDRGAAAAAIYSAAMTHWLIAVVNGQLGALADEALSANGRGAAVTVSQIYTRAVTAMTKSDNGPLEAGGSWADLVEESLIAAVRDLEVRLVKDMRSWCWGDIHHTRPVHPLGQLYPELSELLNPKQVPVGGDQDTPQQGGYSRNDRFVATGMSVNRYVHDPADWSHSRWIVPLGSSGHPGSPHYADQAHMWAAVETIPQLWDWDEIERVSESRQLLEPQS